MYLKNSKKIVIKIGSSLLVDQDKKIRRKWLSSFAVLFISLVFILLNSCGKKSSPEYQGMKIQKKNIINLSKNES